MGLPYPQLHFKKSMATAEQFFGDSIQLKANVSNVAPPSASVLQNMGLILAASAPAERCIDVCDFKEQSSFEDLFALALKALIASLEGQAFAL